MSHRWSAITGAFAARDKLNASISRTGIHENNKKYKPVPEPEVPEPAPAPTLSHVATGQGQSSAYYNTSHWTPTVANAPGYHYHSAQQAWPPRNQGYGTLQPMTLPGYDTTQQLQSSPQQSYSSPQPNNSSTQPNYGSLQSQGSPQQTHAFSAPGNGNANAYQNNQAQSYNGYPPLSTQESFGNFQYSPSSNPNLAPQAHFTTPQRSATYDYSYQQHSLPHRSQTMPIQAAGPRDCCYVDENGLS
jgi:hypothetical protein